MVGVEGCVCVMEAVEEDNHTWPSWMLARHMTVCGERDCGVCEALWC